MKGGAEAGIFIFAGLAAVAGVMCRTYPCCIVAAVRRNAYMMLPIRQSFGERTPGGPLSARELFPELWRCVQKTIAVCIHGNNLW